MANAGSEDDVFMKVVNAVHYYAEGDLTVVELVNEIFLKLAETSRFDLVGRVVDILPSSGREELRRIVEDIGEGRDTYKPFIIGRASEEWWDQIRQRIRGLADLFKPLLETDSAPGRKSEEAGPDGTRGW